MINKTVKIAGIDTVIKYGFYKAGERVVEPGKGFEAISIPYNMHINGLVYEVLSVGARKVVNGLKGPCSSYYQYNDKLYKSEKKVAEAILTAAK